jgi:hypothetical protein
VPACPGNSHVFRPAVLYTELPSVLWESGVRSCDDGQRVQKHRQKSNLFGDTMGWVGREKRAFTMPITSMVPLRPPVGPDVLETYG